VTGEGGMARCNLTDAAGHTGGVVAKARRQGCTMQLENIAPEEIKAAIERSVGESFGLVQDDVATSACRMLGFARVSEDMRVAVEKLRDAMIKEGRLALQGETVTVKAITG